MFPWLSVDGRIFPAGQSFFSSPLLQERRKLELRLKASDEDSSRHGLWPIFEVLIGFGFTP